MAWPLILSASVGVVAGTGIPIGRMGRRWIPALAILILVPVGGGIWQVLSLVPAPLHRFAAAFILLELAAHSVVRGLRPECEEIDPAGAVLHALLHASESLAAALILGLLAQAVVWSLISAAAGACLGLLPRPRTLARQRPWWLATGVIVTAAALTLLPARTGIDSIVIVLLVISLSIPVWSWLWGYRMPAGLKSGAGTWIFSLPLWWRAVVLLLWVLGTVALTAWLWIPLPLSVPPRLQVLLGLAGLATFATGVFLMTWARLALGPEWTVSSGVGVRLHEDHRLVQHGPYAYVRHPLYLGWWMVLLGLLAAYRTWIILIYFLLFLASFVKRAKREEEALRAAFGDEWSEYAGRVPMWWPRWPRR